MGSLGKLSRRKRLAPVPSETDWARLKDDEGKLNDALLERLLGLPGRPPEKQAVPMESLCFF